MKRITLSFALIFIFGVSFSQWLQLDHPLLQGGRVEAFEKFGNDVFIASEGGIFKSADNGNSWVFASDGLSNHNLEIRRIFNHSSGLYCFGYGNLYITIDGNTWNQEATPWLPMNSYIQDFGCANNKLFAIVYSWDTFDYYLYSSDDGINWTQGAFLLNSMGNTKLDMFNFNKNYQFFSVDTLLLYTSNGINIDTVDLSSLNISDSDFGYNFSGEPNGIYIYMNDQDNVAINRYNISSGIWEDVTSNLPTAFSFFSNVKAADSVLFIGHISFLPVLNITLYRSTDHGGTWNNISNHGIHTLSWLEELIQIGSGEFVGMNPFGEVYHSSDNGDTWTNTNSAFIGSKHNSLTCVNNVLLSGSEQLGVLRSTDEGLTWSYSNNGIPPFYQDLFFVNQLFSFGNNAYISCSTDPMTENAELFVSGDNGASWTVLGTEPDSTNNVFAGNNATGFIIKMLSSDEQDYSYQLTIDNGSSWTDITAPVQALNLNNIYGFFGNSAEWYLFGRNSSDFPVAYLSVNNGLTWTEISTGLQGYFFINNEWDWRNHAFVVVDFDIAGFPVIAIQRWDLYPDVVQLYRFDGASWNLIVSSGINPGTERVYNLKRNGNKWFLAAAEGVFVSDDDCSTWTPLKPNHDGLYLGMAPQSVCFINQNIFLGTSGNGIWKTDITSGTDNVTANCLSKSVYPNPFTEFINIPESGETDIVITDISGRIVFEKSGVESKIIPGFLAPGVYTLNVKSDEHKTVYKIIKQ